MNSCDARDTGTRWSHQHLWAQLLPGTLPVSVDIMERYDFGRAASHERLRTAVLRGMTAPTHCPSCGHHLAEAADEPRPDPVMIDRPSPPLLDPRLPLMVMTRVMEAIAWRRPVTQLAHIASESVLRYVRAEAERARRAGPQPSLHAVHVQHVDDRAVELFGLLGADRRRLAFSARLDLTPYGWRLTALRVLHGPAINTASVTAAAATR